VERLLFVKTVVRDENVLFRIFLAFVEVVIIQKPAESSGQFILLLMVAKIPRDLIVLHGVSTQKTAFFIVTTTRTSKKQRKCVSSRSFISVSVNRQRIVNLIYL
jgi:hypothetical protein